MRYQFFFQAIIILAFFSHCQQEVDTILTSNPIGYDSIPVLKPVNPMITEASGIADSKANPGYLWVQEDSGNPPELYLLSHNGAVLKKIYIKNAVNRDWEDMALSGNEIYVGDIGDNNRVYPEYTIYKFSEPSSSADTVTTVQSIKFNYPDGSHDAEAFLVDPVTKDIYIITKRDLPSRIYKLTYPYAALSTVSLVASLSYAGVTGATISPDGKEIIVKTYTSLYHYNRSAGQSIDQALKTNFKTLSYSMEPQGEAVGFASNNSGFFTLSEKGFSSSVNLFFYKRR